MTLQHILIECWMPKARDTHSEYIIRIALPLQQWLHDSATILRYTYISCLVFFTKHDDNYVETIQI
jgi:hypothetical protein